MSTLVVVFLTLETACSRNDVAPVTSLSAARNSSPPEMLAPDWTGVPLGCTLVGKFPELFEPELLQAPSDSPAAAASTSAQVHLTAGAANPGNTANTSPSLEAVFGAERTEAALIADRTGRR
jgi:hypothetical protein